MPRPSPLPERLAQGLLLGAIWLYRHSLSALLGRQCRFVPSCSVYAAEAIRTHGSLRGGLLALRRLSRCHPWSNRSGFDPVPPPG